MNPEAFMAGFDEGLDKLAKGMYGKYKKLRGKVETGLSGRKTEKTPTKELLSMLTKGKTTSGAKSMGVEHTRGKHKGEVKQMGRKGAAGALAARYGPTAGVAGAGALGLGSLLKGKEKN